MSRNSSTKYYQENKTRERYQNLSKEEKGKKAYGIWL